MTDDIDVLVRTGEVVDVLESLHCLLDEERGYPESMADGHGRALAVAIAVLEDCVERSRRLAVVK